MCTVTLLRARGRTVLLCNRDEQRTREPGTPPAFHRAGRRRALYPVDPRSGGSWIGVNDAGLAASLVNATPRVTPRANAGQRSRGEIVPCLLAANSLDEALVLARAIDPGRYPPFRLLLADQHRAVIFDAEIPAPVPAAAPVLLASSSLGDHLVGPPRRVLLDALLIGAHDPLAAQLEFHRHHWPEHPHLSVLMRRPDARTVSRTCISLDDDGASVSTTPIDDQGCEHGLPLVYRLPFLRAAVGASA